MWNPLYQREDGSLVEMEPYCPKCRARLYWSIHCIDIGATGWAMCSKHSSSTQLIYIDENRKFCDWEGYAIRKDEYRIVIYNKDGSPVLLRPVRKR